MNFRLSGDNRFTHWCPGCEVTHTVPVNPSGQIGNGWDYTCIDGKPTLAPSLKHGGYSSKGRPCECHYFIRDGKIQYLSDCNHSYANQTIDLPDIPVGE